MKSNDGKEKNVILNAVSDIKIKCNHGHQQHGLSEGYFPSHDHTGQSDILGTTSTLHLSDYLKIDI